MFGIHVRIINSGKGLISTPVNNRHSGKVPGENHTESYQSHRPCSSSGFNSF